MWVHSRQFTGRIVTVSNEKIFDEPVYNYTRDFPYHLGGDPPARPLHDDRPGPRRSCSRRPATMRSTRDRSTADSLPT